MVESFLALRMKQVHWNKEYRNGHENTKHTSESRRFKRYEAKATTNARCETPHWSRYEPAWSRRTYIAKGVCVKAMPSSSFVTKPWTRKCLGVDWHRHAFVYRWSWSRHRNFEHLGVAHPTVRCWSSPTHGMVHLRTLLWTWWNILSQKLTWLQE